MSYFGKDPALDEAISDWDKAIVLDPTTA